MIIVTAKSFDLRLAPIEYSKTIWLCDQVKFHLNINRT